MERTVCFTGHRRIPPDKLAELQNALNRTIEAEIAKGATLFRTGGARGFDTLAALAVLLARRRYPQIRLELILPCPTQTRGWSAEDKRLYEQILEQADSHRYISLGYYRGVLQMRNRALVEGADTCIAYLTEYDGGGTAFTVSLALKNRLEVINLGDSE